MGAENTRSAELELIAAFDGAFPYDDAVAALADPERVRELRAALERICSPELVTLMAADGTFQREWSGVDGFIAAWRDWTEPWERFETAVEDVLHSGDKAVILVNQTGVPRGGSQPARTDAAAVLTIEDGRITRAEFHLDRAAALRAAGIDPAQSSQAN